MEVRENEENTNETESSTSDITKVEREGLVEMGNRMVKGQSQESTLNRLQTPGVWTRRL